MNEGGDAWFRLLSHGSLSTHPIHDLCETMSHDAGERCHCAEKFMELFVVQTQRHCGRGWRIQGGEERTERRILKRSNGKSIVTPVQPTGGAVAAR